MAPAPSTRRTCISAGRGGLFAAAALLAPFLQSRHASYAAMPASASAFVTVPTCSRSSTAATAAVWRSVRPSSPASSRAPMEAAMTALAATATNGEEMQDQEGGEDLFDFFDPRLSPHEYPSGIDGVDAADAARSADDGDDDGWVDPLRIPNVVDYSGGDGAGRAPARRSEPRTTTEVLIPPETRPPVPPVAPASPSGDGDDAVDDLFDVFDPRLSPHSYPGGIPDSVAVAAAGTTERGDAVEVRAKVGVLLIDHGSRRQSSNDRLLELASAYDDASPDHYVVRAAHMEIVGPDIEQGIRELVEECGVERIVCHPYFLSPGRHVTEDIPQLISDALETLSLDDAVPVTTTDPVGSSLDVMVSAIGTLVDESVRELDGCNAEKKELGGLFGDIQRMLEEEL